MWTNEGVVISIHECDCRHNAKAEMFTGILYSSFHTSLRFGFRKRNTVRWISSRSLSLVLMSYCISVQRNLAVDKVFSSFLAMVSDLYCIIHTEGS